MAIRDGEQNNLSLISQYKDHTVKNPVNSLRAEDLPFNAYNVHTQQIRRLSITIQILDEKTKKVVETIHGRTEDGNISVNAESLIRRDASLKLSINESLFPKPGSLLWFGNICKVYIGIDDNSRPNNMVNFLAGTFWIEEAGYSLDSDGHYIDLKLKDKMMKWEDRQLEYALKIEVDTPIHVAIRALMEHVGEVDFGVIDESREGEVVPYTIEYGVGDDLLDIITELRDMYMDYVVGYDVAGGFEFRRIETQKEEYVEEPKWEFDTEHDTLKTLIEYDESYNFRNIRNRVVVYGGTSDVTGITPSSEVRVTDSKSPFNINAIGEMTEVIIEDRYVLNEQCNARAKYEVYKRSNFQEEVKITTVPIYLLDVFDVVNVVHPFTKVESQYLIDSINIGLKVDSRMTISAHKLYYVSVEYGEEDVPLVNYIINGMETYGWIRLAEGLILNSFGIQASGDASLNVTFISHTEGGFQASVTSYPTTRNQSLEIDLADYQEVDFDSKLGSYIAGSNKNVGDSLSRVLAHEMFHAVMNDYLGHDKSLQTPVWFKEGLAELLHGGHARFDMDFRALSDDNKKQEIIKVADWLLENNFDGSSSNYTASYMIAWAIYRIAKRNTMWSNMFHRLRNENNLSFNFLVKMLPISDNVNSIKTAIIDEMSNNMDDIWTYLSQTPTDNTDTGSVLGVLGENYYGVPLTNETIINVSDYDGNSSIGFNLRFIK